MSTYRCTLCDCTTEEVTHLDLYVIGSEGVNVCLPCRMALTNMATAIKAACGRSAREVRVNRILNAKGAAK